MTRRFLAAVFVDKNTVPLEISRKFVKCSRRKLTTGTWKHHVLDTIRTIGAGMERKVKDEKSKEVFETSMS